MDKEVLARFGEYAPLADAVFLDALRYAPTEREYLSSTIAGTKFRFRNILDADASGEITRFNLHGGAKRYNSINIDIKEYDAILEPPENWSEYLEHEITPDASRNSGDAFEYKRKRTFVHEMLHAVAKARFFPFSADAYPYKTIPSFENPESAICEVLGNTGVYFFRDKVAVDTVFANDFASRMIEEGVVEEWATDLFGRLDTTTTHRPTAYDWTVYLVGMWNAVSNNQLRREHILGEGEDTRASQATQEFKELLDKYLSTMLNPENRENLPEINAENFDLSAHITSIKDLIKFCDHYFLSQQLVRINKETRQHYLNCRKVVLSGQPTYELMQKYFDTKYNLKNINKVQNAYLRTFSKPEYDLTKVWKRRLEHFLKYGPKHCDVEEILQR